MSLDVFGGGGSGGSGDTGAAVRYDVEQSLSAAQQTQARENIGAAEQFPTIGFDGSPIEGNACSNPGWYRLFSFSISVAQAALVHINHAYYSGGPSDLLVYICGYEWNPRVQIISASFHDFNSIMIDNIRMTKNGSVAYVDIHYSTLDRNVIGFDVIGTTGNANQPFSLTRLNCAAVADSPEGETVLTYAEWSDPPMALGVEYRTTERYLGKPVYTKVIDCGDIKNSGTKTIAHGIENIDCAVRCVGTLKQSNSSNVFTVPYANDGDNIYITGTHANIVIYQNYTISVTLAAQATFYYTKTTD